MKHKKQIIIIGITIFVIVLTTIGLLAWRQYEQKHQYIKTSKRTSHVIRTVDETFLDRYVSPSQNTLVVFWASWCPYCVEESEDLNNFMNNNPNIPVVVISSDHSEEELKKYLEEHQYNWYVVLDTEKTIRGKIDPGSKGIPSSYVLDKNQKILTSYKDALTEKQFLSFYHMTFDPSQQEEEE